MSRNWKIGAQTQMPESPNKIELSRVTYDDGSGQVTVVGRSEADGKSPDVRVGFDGQQVPVLTVQWDPSWEANRVSREFTVTAMPVDLTATSIEVRIDQSAVTAHLE